MICPECDECDVVLDEHLAAGYTHPEAHPEDLIRRVIDEDKPGEKDEHF